MNKIKKIFEGFSLKKYLITVLCTIVIINFIGFTCLFVYSMDSYMIAEIASVSEADSQLVKDIGSHMEELFKLSNENTRAVMGDDYPAEGMLLFELTRGLKTVAIVRGYTLFALIGLALGTVIYIVFVQKVKGVQLLLEVLVFGLIIILLVLGSNLIYRMSINTTIGAFGMENTGFYGDILDINLTRYVIIYTIIIGGVYLINLIYQKLLANKLNKKLNHK